MLARSLSPSYCNERRRSRLRPHAFTLIELLVSLALTMVASLAAWPVLSNWGARLAVDWTVHRLLVAIAYARSEAIHRGAPTTLCRSGVDGQCSTRAQHCGGAWVPGNDWRCGWLVVAGHRLALRDGRPLPVLRRFEGRGGIAVIAGRNINPLSYRPPVGQALGSPGSFQVMPGASVAGAGDRAGARSTTLPVRCIAVSIAGRPRVREGACR